MTTIIAPADVTPELILIGLVATFLTAATVWVLWYVFETIFTDDVRDPRFFLTFVIVFVPFAMLIYFGLDALIDDAIACVSMVVDDSADVTIRRSIAEGGELVASERVEL
jgi:hypothetical protein